MSSVSDGWKQREKDPATRASQLAQQKHAYSTKRGDQKSGLGGSLYSMIAARTIATATPHRASAPVDIQLAAADLRWLILVQNFCKALGTTP